MTVEQLTGGHVGWVVSLKQASDDESVRVHLVGTLNSYELQWAGDRVVYAWLVIGGKEHTLDNPAAVAGTTIEVYS